MRKHTHPKENRVRLVDRVDCMQICIPPPGNNVRLQRMVDCMQKCTPPGCTEVRVGREENSHLRPERERPQKKSLRQQHGKQPIEVNDLKFVSPNVCRYNDYFLLQSSFFLSSPDGQGDFSSKGRCVYNPFPAGTPSYFCLLPATSDPYNTANNQEYTPNRQRTSKIIPAAQYIVRVKLYGCKRGHIKKKNS